MIAERTHSDRFASVFVTAPDGLTLHVRRYGADRGQNTLFPE
jgi:hypothetical protein